MSTYDAFAVQRVSPQGSRRQLGRAMWNNLLNLEDLQGQRHLQDSHGWAIIAFSSIFIREARLHLHLHLKVKGYVI